MYFLGGQRWQKWQRWWKGENGETSSLCRLRAVQTQVWGTPSQSVRSCSPGWKVGGKEQGSRTQREREWVAVKWSGTQSVSHSGQSGRQAARQCIWVQAGCAPTPRTYNPRWGGGGCAPRCSNLSGLLHDPSPTSLFWERRTGLFIGLAPLIQKASVCGWLQWRRRGVSRMGWGSSRAERGGVGWRGGKGNKKTREEGNSKASHVLFLTVLLAFPNSPPGNHAAFLASLLFWNMITNQSFKWDPAYALFLLQLYW